MELTDFLLATFIILFIVQLFVLYRIFAITNQFTRLLLEIRLLFKHVGISYEPRTKKISDQKICQYCKFRLSFIKMSDNDAADDFYYKCRKKNLEVHLNDSCKYFEWDLTPKQ